MNRQTIFRFLGILIVFGSPGILAALSEGTAGKVALVVGCISGLVAAELHIPNLLKEWQRVGTPGDLRTPEQQRQWEQEVNRRKRGQNLAVIVGLFIAALIRPVFKDRLLLPVAAIFGGITVYALKIGWLVYQKRGRLGP